MPFTRTMNVHEKRVFTSYKSGVTNSIAPCEKGASVTAAFAIFSYLSILGVTACSEAYLFCRVEQNLGPITNIEVLKVLERRGANREWSRKKTLPSERKVPEKK